MARFGNFLKMPSVRRIEAANHQHNVHWFVHKLEHSLLSFLGSVANSVAGTEKMKVYFAWSELGQHGSFKKLADLFGLTFQHSGLISNAHPIEMSFRFKTLRTSFAESGKK